MGFFKDKDGNNSMARLVTFMGAIGGLYNAALIPFAENGTLCLQAAIGLLTAAGVTKAVTKLTEAKNA